jgi:FdhD protein
MKPDFLAQHASKSAQRTRRVGVARFEQHVGRSVEDVVAVEEPLEIRLAWQLRGRLVEKSISVTMRTPGHDRELAVGFLFGEGIIETRADVERFESCGEGPAANDNVLRVHVSPELDVDMGALKRHFYTTSSCGVCGKASIEALEVDDCRPIDDKVRFGAALVGELPGRLRGAQRVFEDTGGLHAAGLFGADGEPAGVFEDVGRHNAMDKLVGAQLLDGHPALSQAAVVWSGRASFELVQKAVRARAPVVVAVGAPSSLAVDLAEEFGVTLVGFARHDRFNVYTHPRRIT